MSVSCLVPIVHEDGIKSIIHIQSEQLSLMKIEQITHVVTFPRA